MPRDIIALDVQAEEDNAAAHRRAIFVAVTELGARRRVEPSPGV